MGKKKTGGGKAANIGPEYQNRCQAWYCVQILAEIESVSPSLVSNRAVCQYVLCETDQPTDDLLVGYSDERLSFEQAKHSINLSRKKDTPFASVIDQFVRQFIHGQDANSILLRPWERKLDPTKDALALLSQNASQPIAVHLKTVLENLRGLMACQPTEDAAANKSQENSLQVTISQIKTAWSSTTNDAITNQDIRKILNMMHVRILCVDEGSHHEEQAISILKTSVLKDPHQAEACWKLLIQHGFTLARTPGGGTLSSIQNFLLRNEISVRWAPSYRNDLEKLKGNTDETIEHLKKFSEIKRPKLNMKRRVTKVFRPVVKKLVEAVQASSIVVVGEPGAGKSAVLYDAVVELGNLNIDVIAFAVGRVGSKSLGELRTEIGLEHDLVSLIKNWPTPKGVLVIDAMDAGRGERTQSMLRDLIIRVSDRCPNWRILISIRKYELRYNPELGRIFVGKPDAEFTDPEFNKIRHINVAQFTNEEVDQIPDSVPELAELISCKSASLFDLIRVPFNLKLIVEMIDDGVAVGEISAIASQVELLDRYWMTRVIGTEGGDAREVILTRVVQAMLETRRLVASRTSISTDPSFDKPMGELLSAQVLKEWQQTTSTRTNRYQIEFGHHVLFDFAVERLIIRGDPDFISKKLSQEPDLLFAVRPSIDIHFRYLWCLDTSRKIFWDQSIVICQNDSALTVVRLIGPMVAAELAENTSDIAQLQHYLNDTTNTRKNMAAIDTFKHLCNALMTLAGENDECGVSASPWVDLFEGIVNE